MTTALARRTAPGEYARFFPVKLVVGEVEYQPQFFNVASHEELAAIDVYRVEVTPPEGKQWVLTFNDDNGVPVAVFEDIPPPPVPDRVTSRQFKLQLLASDPIGLGDTLLDDVEAWISAQSRAVQVAFEYSGSFVRDEPMMVAGFAALGFTEQQIDAFFTAASQR